jgi:cholesterol 7-dehydrogenase
MTSNVISVPEDIDATWFIIISIVMTTVVINIIGIMICSYYCRTNHHNKTKKSRRDRKATYPQQYPTGWYRMCNSSDVKKGQSKQLCFFETDFVVFRGEDGKALVCDSICPHLGTNISVGAIVKGNCITCPFHGWEFSNVDGACTKIPYTTSIPSQAKLFTYHTVERYGMIAIWWNEDHRDEEPLYPFITVDDFEDTPDKKSKFEYRYSFPYPSIKMHMQEFAENTVDVQHFGYLHGQMRIPFTYKAVPGIVIDHKASFNIGKEKHQVEFGDNACLKLFGREIPNTRVQAKILFHGPGSIVLFRFDTPMGRIYIWQTHTPNHHMDLDVMFNVWAEKMTPRFISWYITGNWISQWYNDVMIWENKIYLPKPLLVKGDGPVMKLRRWFQQFYNRDTMSW